MAARVGPGGETGVAENGGASPAAPAPPAAPTAKDDFPLSGVDRPHAHDVMCGRGGGTNNHAGNQHWRRLVSSNKRLYLSLPKRRKMQVAKSIVQAIRMQDPPGRFLQKDAKTKTWYDIGDEMAQHKTSQALREGAPEIRGAMKNEEERRRKMMATGMVSMMPRQMQMGTSVAAAPQMQARMHMQQMQMAPRGQFHPFAMGVPLAGGLGAQQGGVPSQQQEREQPTPIAPAGGTSNWAVRGPDSAPQLSSNLQVQAMLAAQAQAKVQAQAQARARKQQQQPGVPPSAQPIVPSQAQQAGEPPPALPRASPGGAPTAHTTADAGRFPGGPSPVPPAVVAVPSLPASAPQSLAPSPALQSAGAAAAAAVAARQGGIPKSASTCELTAQRRDSLQRQQAAARASTAQDQSQAGAKPPLPASAPQSTAASPGLVLAATASATVKASADTSSFSDPSLTQDPPPAAVAAVQLAAQAQAAAQAADTIAEEARKARREYELLQSQIQDSKNADAEAPVAAHLHSNAAPGQGLDLGPGLPMTPAERAAAAAAAAEKAAEEARRATEEYEMLCRLHKHSSDPSSATADPTTAAMTMGPSPSLPAYGAPAATVGAALQGGQGDHLGQLQRSYLAQMQQQPLLDTIEVGPPTLQARSSLGRRLLPPNAAVRFTYDNADRAPRGGERDGSIGQHPQANSLLDDDDEEEEIGRGGSLRMLVPGSHPGIMNADRVGSTGGNADAEQWNKVKAMIEKKSTSEQRFESKKRKLSAMDANGASGRPLFGVGDDGSVASPPSTVTARADSFGPLMPGFDRGISMMSNISGCFSDIGGDDNNKDGEVVTGKREEPTKLGSGDPLAAAVDAYARSQNRASGTEAVAEPAAGVAAPTALIRGLSGSNAADSGPAVAAAPPTVLIRGQSGISAADGADGKPVAAAAPPTTLLRGISGSGVAVGGMASAAAPPTALLRGLSGIHAAGEGHEASSASVAATPTSLLRGLSGHNTAMGGLAAVAAAETAPMSLLRDISAFSISGGMGAAGATPTAGLLRGISGFSAVGNLDMPGFNRDASAAFSEMSLPE